MGRTSVLLTLSFLGQRLGPERLNPARYITQGQLPGQYLAVNAQGLRYQGRDPAGQPIDRTVSDFHARVVQHECDHLDGILYPMRIRDLRDFGFHDVLFPDQPPIDE